MRIFCLARARYATIDKRYEVWGLDLSRQMLALAKKKVPRAKLTHQNMVSFRLLPESGLKTMN
jgi:ubiquinone/menaquinone biosynthesis C-methylase UbiE